MDGRTTRKVALTSPTPTTLQTAADRPAGSPWHAAGWGVASTVATALLSYAFQILVARVMSPASYADTLAMLSLYMLFSLPLSPILLLVTRRVVQAHQQQDEGGVRALLWTLGRRGALLGAGLVLLVFLLRAPLARLLGIGEPLALPLLALSVVLSALYLLTVAVLLGRLNWRVANGLPVLFGVTRIGLSLLLVAPGFEVGATFAAITASALVCLAIGLRAALHGLPHGGRHQPLHLAEVATAVAINAAFWFVVQIDTIYVNRQLPGLAAQGYVAASGLAKMLVYIPLGVGNILFPLLMSATSDRARRRVLLRMMAVAVALDVAGLLVIAAAPDQILRLTLGPSHAGAADFLLAAGLVMAPLSLGGMVLYDALARHDRLLTSVFVVTALVVAAALASVTPGLPLLFTTLALASAGLVTAGVVRGLRPRSEAAP